MNALMAADAAASEKVVVLRKEKSHVKSPLISSLALVSRDQPQHAIGPTETPRGRRHRRASLLRTAPAARRIRADREGQGLAPGATRAARLGTASHEIPGDRQVTSPLYPWRTFIAFELAPISAVLTDVGGRNGR